MASGHTGNVSASQQNNGAKEASAENTHKTTAPCLTSDARLAAIQSHWDTLTEPIRVAMFALLQAATSRTK